MLSGVLEPRSQMIERVASGNVVNKKGASGTAVVGPGNRAERLLSSSVPDLKLDLLTVDRHHTSSKLDTYRMKMFKSSVNQQ